MNERATLVNVGRITSVFGVRGWVKVLSHTEPPDNILSYQPWWLKMRHGIKAVEIDDSKPHGQGWVAHIKGVDDRDIASEFTQVDIAVHSDQLPLLSSDEFYWHQLQDLTVISEYGDHTYLLGRVKKLIETGANDVLVVQGNGNSMDQRERLIPYLPGQVVKSVDLERSQLTVNWDPEF